MASENSRSKNAGGSECFDEMDVGEEFKMVPLAIRKTALNGISKVRDAKSKLIHCPKCNESWNYSAKQKGACPACKSAVTYKCGKCKKFFASLASLMNHVNKYCAVEPSFFCGHCDFKTNFKKNLSDHVQAKHIPRNQASSYQCSNCSKSYSRNTTLNRHLKVCGKPKIPSAAQAIFCDHCDYKANRKAHLSIHIQTKHQPADPNANRCEACGKSFPCHEYLSKHLQFCAQSRDASTVRFCCDHCDYKAYKKYHLSQHINLTHQLKSTKLNKCGKCGRCYKHAEYLKRHLLRCGRSIVKAKNLSCDHCDFRTNQKVQLAGHIQSKHLTVSFKCEVCAKSFGSQMRLRTHLKATSCRSSVGSKAYFCKYCDDRFTAKNLLDVHLRSKHSEEAYKCDRCGKCYEGKKALYHHQNFTGCSLSNRSIRYSCDHCTYKSLNKQNFLNHVQAKHSSDTFECKTCKKSFGCQANLYRHAKFSCKMKKLVLRECSVTLEKI